GEKARLVLALIVWQRPNLLLLDEPTNHLDLATREALSMAINDFDGTVMLVSHDRALLRAVCDEFWMVGRGAVGPFDGDLDDYQRYLLDESKRLREEAKNEESKPAALAPAPALAPAAVAPVAAPATPVAPAAAGPAVDQKEQRRLAALARQELADKIRPFKKELEANDKKLAQLTAERAQIEQRLTEPLPPAEIVEAGKRLKACSDEIDALEERWLEINDAMEGLTAQAGNDS
ncbi:MAG: ABC transporter, partial [Comamonas sp.]